MTSIYCEDPDGNLVEVSTYARVLVAWKVACNFWLVNPQPEIAEEKKGVRLYNARAFPQRGVAQVHCQPLVRGNRPRAPCVRRGVPHSGAPFGIIVRGLWV